MGETLLPVATSFNASLSIEARPEHLTGDAGAVLVREVIERTGILEHRHPRAPASSNG